MDPVDYSLVLASIDTKLQVIIAFIIIAVIAYLAKYVYKFFNMFFQ